MRIAMKKLMEKYFLGAVTRKNSTIELINCRATRMNKSYDDITYYLFLYKAHTEQSVKAFNLLLHTS